MTIFAAAKALAVFSTPGAAAFANAVNAAFNLGWVGGVFGVGVFLVGMGVGAGIYAFKTSKELKESREKLKKRFEDNEEKIKGLELIEAQNAKLRQLVKERFGNDKHTKMLQSSSDRDNRRVTTERNPIRTALKEIGDNLRYAVNKLGQAVLVHRSIVFPTLGLLGMAGITKLAIIGSVAGALIAAVAPFTLPAIIVVLAVSAIWMGITTYKYVKDKQYQAANRFLDGVEDGTRKAQLETEQGLLLQKLNYNNGVEVGAASVNSISSEASILNALNAGQVESKESILTSIKNKANNVKNLFLQKATPKPGVNQTSIEVVSPNAGTPMPKPEPNAGEPMTSEPEAKEPNRCGFFAKVSDGISFVASLVQSSNNS